MFTGSWKPGHSAFTTSAKSWKPGHSAFTLSAKSWKPGHSAFTLSAKSWKPGHSAFTTSAKSWKPGHSAFTTSAKQSSKRWICWTMNSCSQNASSEISLLGKLHKLDFLCLFHQKSGNSMEQIFNIFYSKVWAQLVPLGPARLCRDVPPLTSPAVLWDSRSATDLSQRDPV